MPTTTVKFSNGTADDAVINGPVSDQPVSPKANHVTDTTMGGVRYVYKMSSMNRWMWTLQFDAVTSPQKDKLIQFFYHPSVDGPTSTWSYTHTDGNVYTARFLQPSLPFGRVNSNLWTVQIELELETSVS